MCVKGGYKMLDLKNQSLSTTKTTITGIYESIENNYKKVLMLCNINIENIEKANAFVTFNINNTAYECIVYGYTIKITNDDEVTATAVQA